MCASSPSPRVTSSSARPRRRARRHNREQRDTARGPQHVTTRSRVPGATFDRQSWRVLFEALIMPGFSATLAAKLDIPRLFEQAHWIVQAVMVLLAVMFVVGLYIIIYKRLYIGRASG